MQTFFQDLRYALRQLRKAPGFALVAVLSLTLGIGATTAVFSIVYAVLLHPYPFRDWERLVTLNFRDQRGNIDCCLNVNGAQLQRLREANSIEEVVGFDQQSLTTTGGDLPEDVSVISWTTNAVSYFGVPPALGRGFLLSDAPEGQDPQPVAMLSYLFWQRHFGGDPNILSQSIELAHKNYKIVGVMSPYITWGGAGVYLPLKLPGDPRMRLGTSVRLKRGVSTEAANADLQPLLEAFARETPMQFPPGFHAYIRPLSYGITTSLGPSLRLLFGAVCLLLLIGCLNVSILLLARGTKRRYELAVRAALGAARTRIVRQLLTESLMLAVIGEALGIALAYTTQRILIQQLPAYLMARKALIYINLPVLSFSIVLTLLTVLAFGLMPAVQFSRRELGHAMQLGVQRHTGGWGKQTRHALIAGQIALSLTLLAAAATSIRVFVRLLHTNLGYDPQNTIALGIPVHQNSYLTWEERSAYFDRLQQKIASTPDVTAAALSIGAVPPFNGWNTTFEILGQNMLGGQQVSANFVSPEYFGVLHIPLLRGRLWNRTETLRAAHVALINQTMARQYWPDGDAIGKQIRLPLLVSNPPDQLAAPASDQWLEIIGIVGDAINNGLRNPIKPAAYLPYTFRMPMATQILARTRTNPLSLLRTFRAQVQAVDPEQQVMNGSSSLEEFITLGQDWQREHTVAILFAAFAVITLVMAGVGLYSVVSYTVAQRTNEFALRMALGARPTNVLMNVLLSTLGVVAVGVAAGMGLYLLVKRVVSQWAYAPADEPWILLLVTPLLLCVAILACYLPARRAMAVDPMTALRHE
jgi:predicted permease